MLPGAFRPKASEFGGLLSIVTKIAAAECRSGARKSTREFTYVILVSKEKALMQTNGWILLPSRARFRLANNGMSFSATDR
jgi:hypothetical protein